MIAFPPQIRILKNRVMEENESNENNSNKISSNQDTEIESKETISFDYKEILTNPNIENQTPDNEMD